MRSVLRIVFVAVLLVAIVVVLVSSSLRSVGGKSKIQSVYLKILMNHLQLLVLCSEFDFEWPRMVRSFLEAPEPLASSTDSIVKVDCLLDQREETT